MYIRKGYLTHCYVYSPQTVIQTKANESSVLFREVRDSSTKIVYFSGGSSHRPVSAPTQAFSNELTWGDGEMFNHSLADV